MTGGGDGEEIAPSRLPVVQLAELVEGKNGVGGVHQGRAAAHVEAHAERLLEFGAGGAEPHQRLGMKADAAVAAGGDGDGHGDELLGLAVERPVLGRRPGEGGKAAGGLGDLVAQRLDAGGDAPGDVGVGFGHERPSGLATDPARPAWKRQGGMVWGMGLWVARACSLHEGITCAAIT